MGLGVLNDLKLDHVPGTPFHHFRTSLRLYELLLLVASLCLRRVLTTLHVWC